MVLTTTRIEPIETEPLIGDLADAFQARAVEPTRKRSKRRRELWRMIAASIVIVSFVLLTVAGLIPESATSAKVDQVFHAPMKDTGVRQNWSVFSPNPLRTEVRLKAVIYFEDGTSTEWLPATANVFDSSRAERWRKWETRVRQDTHIEYWPIAAEFISNHFTDDPRTVEKVRLVRTWSEVPLPPEPNSNRQVQEFQFYEWDRRTSTGTELTQFDQLPVGLSS